MFGFECTENHPIYIERDNDRMWVDAKNVIVGDLLLSPIKIDDSVIYSCHVVTSIETYFEDDVDVYNFEVEEDHSYLAFGVVVHNCHCTGALS